MNCQQIDKYIYEFCDKQLPPQMQDSIQHHLDECENCRNKVESARREGMVLRSLPIGPALQPQFTDDIMTVVRQRYGKTQPGLLPGRSNRYPQQLRWWWGVAGAAVLILALCSLPLLEKPLGTKLADQNSDAIVQTDVLSPPANAIPEETAQTIPPQADEMKENTPEQPRQVPRQNTYHKDASLSEPVAHQFSTAAVADGVMKSVLKANPNRGVDLLTLYPANLPPNYLLQSIISPSDQEITFVYENQTTDQELRLMLTVVNDSLQNNERAVTGEDPLLRTATITPPQAAGSDSAASPKIDKLANSVQMKLDHNQQPYQVLLSAEMSTEELTSIADAIKLEEGVHRVMPANP